MGTRLYMLPDWYGDGTNLIPLGFGYEDGDEFYLWGQV